jgi:protein-S-isoprenylcysteine O-methyltransferase Ste14
VILVPWAGIPYGFSPLTLLLRIAGTAGMLVRVFSEEHLLRARYPDYADYSKRTKRIVPRVF